MEAYYYQQMDRTGQSIYHAMKTGFAELRPSFPVPCLDGRRLSGGLQCGAAAGLSVRQG